MNLDLVRGALEDIVADDRRTGDVIRYARPCCLVLDVRMPGLSGLDLQTALAAAGRRLSIVFVTGHADVPKTVQAMKNGAVDVLTKPFGARELLNAVQQAVAKDVENRSADARVAEVGDRAKKLSPREMQVFARRDRVVEQADRGRAGGRREDDQGAPGPGDDENAGGIGGRAGSAADRLGVVLPTAPRAAVYPRSNGLAVPRPLLSV